MPNVDEYLNLGTIDPTLPVTIRNQFQKLYNELEDRWRLQAFEINNKPDVYFNEINNASYTPTPAVTLTQFRQGTIYVDLVPGTPTVWQLTEKILNAGNIESVWIQLG